MKLKFKLFLIVLLLVSPSIVYAKTKEDTGSLSQEKQFVLEVMSKNKLQAYSKDIESLDFALNSSSVEIIIGWVEDSTVKDAESHLTKLGISSQRHIHGKDSPLATLCIVPLDIFENLVSQLDTLEEVRYYELNYKVQSEALPNDPDWVNQYGPRLINIPDAWDLEKGNRSILVSVIDSGIDYDHPDLASNYVDLGFDFVNWDGDPMDDNGHGTHCAGVIAASINNSIGVAGLANVSIMAEKGLDSSGSGYDGDLADCIYHSVDSGADILSNSWGSNGISSLIRDAVEYAQANGVLVIAAAGNDASNDLHYPAAFSGVMAVTATDDYDDPAGFTNYGYWVDVAAPGVDIYSTDWDNTYSYKSGTSMATPHVAGLAALIWSKYPGFTAQDVFEKIVLTSEDLGPTGFDPYYGYGRIDTYAALLPPSEHELKVDLDVPDIINPGATVYVNITVENMGLSTESELYPTLQINGSNIYQPYISSLSPDEFWTGSYEWSPSNGSFNVTLYLEPLTGETVLWNNKETEFITIGYTVNHYGDLVFDEGSYTVFSDIIIHQYGDIWLKPDSTLILDNCSLVLYSNGDTSTINLTNGTLVLQSSTIYSDYWFDTYCYGNSNVISLYSGIYDFSNPSYSVGSVSLYDDSYLYSEASVLGNLRFYDWAFGDFNTSYVRYIDCSGSTDVSIIDSVIDWRVSVSPFSDAYVTLVNSSLDVLQFGYSEVANSSSRLAVKEVPELDYLWGLSEREQMNYFKDEVKPMESCDNSDSLSVDEVIYIENLSLGQSLTWDSDQISPQPWYISLENVDLHRGVDIDLLGYTNAVINNCTLSGLYAHDYVDAVVNDSSIELFSFSPYSNASIDVYCSDINHQRVWFYDGSYTVDTLRPGEYSFLNLAESGYISGPIYWGLNYTDTIVNNWQIIGRNVVDLCIDNSLINLISVDSDQMYVEDSSIGSVGIIGESLNKFSFTNIECLETNGYTGGLYFEYSTLIYLITRDSDFNIYGNLTFGENTRLYYENATVYREYPIIGEPGTQVRIEDSLQNTVFNDNVSSKGIVFYTGSYTDYNFTDSYLLYMDDNYYQKLNLTSNTPIGLDTGVYAVNLKPGWNLVGNPLSNVLVEDLLSGNTENVDYVYGYINGSWVYWIPELPSNTLSLIESGSGYWIHVKNSFTLTFEGAPETPTPQSGEWYLLSLMQLTSLDLVGEDLTDIKYIYGFDNTEKNYLYWINGLPDEYQTLKTLEPGHGFWLCPE